MPPSKKIADAEAPTAGHIVFWKAPDMGIPPKPTAGFAPKIRATGEATATTIATVVTTATGPYPNLVTALEKTIGLGNEMIHAAQKLSLPTDGLADLIASAVAEVSFPAAGASDPGAGLTSSERAALADVGALLEPLPPARKRASSSTATRSIAIALRSLSVDEVAARIGRSNTRVRQRLADRTLLGIRQGAGWRVPAFQFTATGELPDWSKVAPVFPEDVVLPAVERFLNQPNPDLVLDGDAVTPREWLLKTLDAGPVASAVANSYTAP